MSPYDKLKEKARQDEAAYSERVRQAKLNLRYALLKVSERKWRIVSVDIQGFHGDGNGNMIPMPRCTFLTGNLNYFDATESFLKLQANEITVDQLPGVLERQ